MDFKEWKPYFIVTDKKEDSDTTDGLPFAEQIRQAFIKGLCFSFKTKTFYSAFLS